MIKPAYQQPIDRSTLEATIDFFDKLLRLLHPFMPFVTEELWQAIAERKAGESIMVALMPQSGRGAACPNRSINVVEGMDEAKAIISNIRTIRLQRNIPAREALSLQVVGTYSSACDAVISKMANLSGIDSVATKAAGAVTFLVGTTEFAVPLTQAINVEEELAKLNAELTHQRGFLELVLKKLNNERFVANAKPEVVAGERQKQATAESKIKTLEENITALQ
jgi:valyl-tRNA synthetase